MKFRILGIILLLALVTAVSADVTCSFINITTGPTGAAGAAGTNGTSCTTGVNFTFTLATGNPATATNVGTATNALLDFGIPVGATGAKGDTGATGAIPDVTQFLFINGTRAMTGNLSMGGFYINSLLTGGLGSDAVNKSYVDAVNASLSLGAFTSTHPVTLSNNVKVIGGGVAASLTNDKAETIAEISTNVTLGNNNSSIPTSGAVKSYVDTVNASMKGYVDALGTSNYNASYNSLIRGDYVYTGNTSYVLTNNASYVLTNNASYVLTNNASYVLTNNASYVKNPVFGYVTLMAGSAMVTTTNPVAMNQWETSSNKNNYISLNFTDGGTEVAQWIVDFPADWNATGNVVFTTIWTTAEGGANTGVNWTIKGKLLGDHAALDTALATVGYSNSTWNAAGDVHIGTPSTGAAITAVGTGNTAIIAVSRDASDDLAGTAQLLGLRVKYIRTLA